MLGFDVFGEEFSESYLPAGVGTFVLPVNNFDEFSYCRCVGRNVLVLDFVDSVNPRLDVCVVVVAIFDIDGEFVHIFH